jgi:hypothetical protein
MGALVLFTVAIALNYRRRLRPLPSQVRRRVTLAFLLGAALAALTGLVLLALVVLPTNDAVANWASAQQRALQVQNCPAQVGTAFMVAWAHAQERTQTWLVLGLVLALGGSGIVNLWALRMAVVGAPPPAQPDVGVPATTGTS